MTCKDCIHNEVCSQFSKIDGDTYANLSEKSLLERNGNYE